MKEQLLRQYDMLPRRGTVLCAVSGGKDSMCLLSWLCSLSDGGGFTVAVAHYNHGLRGENADRDEKFVREYCARNGIPCYCGHGDVRAAAKLHGWTIEEAARNLRYAFLERTAAEMGAARIALAHNAEDNAETVLLNLVRGSGMTGLTGIAPVRGIFIRPLLNTSRAEIEEYLREHHIENVEDETNTDLELKRNLVRLRIMPLLREINPAATESINRTANILREENRYLNRDAARYSKTAKKENGSIFISRQLLGELPPPMAKRVLLRLMDDIGVGKKDITAAHLEDILRLAKDCGPSARLDLPRNLVVRNVYDRLSMGIFSSERAALCRTALPPVGQVDAGAYHIECRVLPAAVEEKENRLVLDNGKIDAPVFVDSRTAGDCIKPAGRCGKSVKKWMIDEKIPAPRRDEIPVIYVGDRVAAVLGIGCDEKFAPGDSGDKLVIDFYNR